MWTAESRNALTFHFCLTCGPGVTLSVVAGAHANALSCDLLIKGACMQSRLRISEHVEVSDSLLLPR
jgi:hypothetical protein